MANEFYNLTNTSGGNFLTLVKGTNDALNSFPIFGILISIWVLLFFGLIVNGPTKAYAISSFITGVIGILFTLAGLLSASWLSVFIIILALVGGSVLIFNKNQDIG